MIDSRILWGKCANSAEYQSIRIAASAVMDELKWPYLTGASFVLERLYKEKEKVVFRVPEGYGKVDDHVKMVGKEIKRATPILVFYVVELF